MLEIAIPDSSVLTVHPAATLFPMLDESELASLAEDVHANGLLAPIVVLDGVLLDGRNRLRACEIASVPPRFVEWSGTGSVAKWICSVNLRRRHLSPSQRALLAAPLAEVFEKEAKERQKRGVADPDAARSRHKAAESLGVGATTVLRAQQVIAKGTPELVAAVAAGDVAVRAASEVLALPPEEQRALVREKKVAEGARQARAQRQPPAVPEAPRPAPRSSVTPSHATNEEGGEEDVDEDPRVGERGADDDTDGERSGDDPKERIVDRSKAPAARPFSQTIFRSEYKKGKSPNDEAARVDQILAAASSALDAWRFMVIEWKEDRRVHMLFALDQSGELASHLNHAVASLKELSAICNGRKPAPPLQRS